LSAESQKVSLNGIFSNSVPVSSGVPQGSVLGRVLFLIYINDLASVISDDVKCVMFANDVKLYKGISCENDLKIIQATLNKIYDWCNCKLWQINLSPKNALLYTLGKNNNKHQYTIGDNVLESFESCRDLGVLISHVGKFTSHIKQIVQTAYYKISVLLKTFQSGTNIDLLKKAYVSYVRPHLEYCSIIWSLFCIQDINMLERDKNTSHADCYTNNCSHILKG
jgi:ribonucleases P/MRP protein subunit RPP40